MASSEKKKLLGELSVTRPSYRGGELAEVYEKADELKFMRKLMFHLAKQAKKCSVLNGVMC